MNFKNGDRVKDRVSGITGIVVGITKWATGCDTLTIQPPAKPDGTLPDTLGFDINRVDMVESGCVSFDLDSPAKVGGPQPSVSRDLKAK